MRGLRWLAAAIVVLSVLERGAASERPDAASERAGVAVIGSGISGSVAALQLRRMAGDSIEIDVFEREEEVGGRMQTVHVPGVDEPVEIGASIYHESNKRVRDLARELNLTERSPMFDRGTIGIWDGAQGRFVFESSSWGLWTKAKGLLRYGLSALRSGRVVGEAVANFTRNYELFEGEAFPSVPAFLEATGLAALPAQTLRARLEAAGVGEAYLSEPATAILRVNYNQNLSINALAGLVGLAGSGATLLSVRGGNRLLAERALRAAAARLSLAHPVEAVEGPRGGPYTLRLASGATRGPYRAVILAGDAGGGAPAGVPFGRADGDLPSSVFTTDAPDPDLPFTCISRLRAIGPPSRTGPGAVQALLAERLPDALLERLFGRPVWTFRRAWRAYPALEAGREAAAVELAPGLLYAGALEALVSTIESQAIAGRNAAALAATLLPTPHAPRPRPRPPPAPLRSSPSPSMSTAAARTHPRASARPRPRPPPRDGARARTFVFWS
eukprot:tig00000865_g5098.t1